MVTFWQISTSVLCQMVVDQTFEGGAWLGGKKKAKPGRPSSFARDPRHQDHAKLNARILGNAQALQRQNDQKVVSCARAKIE